MQKITPFLWFDHNAEEAVKFYTSIFKDSKKGETVRRWREEPVRLAQRQVRFVVASRTYGLV